jgi:hypothetical protein
MSNVTAMAAQFTDVSLEQMTTFLKRAFHALEPQKVHNIRGEIAVELPLSDKASIMVYTSVAQGGANAAGIGSDAIRVGLYRQGRPLQSGKLPIVKRTQGWKDNLRERIEDAMEKYDSRAEDIDAGKFIQW